MKNPFKRKANHFPKPVAQPEPRALKDIQAEYNQVTSIAGTKQYQMFVLENELKQINTKMLELNKEGDVRIKLDKAAAEQAKVAEAAAAAGAPNV